MSLRRTLRSGVAAACIVGVAAPAGYAAPAVSSRPALDVRVAQAKDFTRLEFHWAGGARVSTRRDGQALILRFSRDARPDIALLRAIPPKWLKSAEARHVGGALEIVLTLDDNAEAKVGQADGATFVNIAEKKVPEAPATPPPAEVAAAPAPPPRANPVPPGGVVPVAVETPGGQLRMRFDWAAPVGAAVFRRGEAVWVVFDAAARLNTGKLSPAGEQYRKLQTLNGKDYTALRLVVPRGASVSVAGQGTSWTLAVGGGPPAGRDTGGGAITVSRDSEQAGLTAAMAGAGRPVWVDDPAVGDRLAVVPALAPAKGLAARRDFVDLSMLPTLQGLAMEAYAPNLSMVVEGDLVRIGKGGDGLELSPAWAHGGAPVERAELGPPTKASMPALIGDRWSQTGEGGFMERYDQLMAAAAAETAKGATAPTEARMALARFLVGTELSYEAIGVLNAAARSRETLMGDAEFRGLRGVARTMAGRLKEADSDLSVGVLADDPSSSAWQAYIASKQGQWADARSKFAQSAQAMDLFPPLWRARFQRADAEAAIALGDFNGAEDCLRRAAIDGLPPAEELATQLTRAKLLEARGEKDRALAIYELIAKAPLEQYAAPALLRATQIKLDQGKINAAQAAPIFDGLRYRWRGDATELETIRALGKLYLSQGRYREALETLRSAGTRLPADLQASVDLQNDLSAAFKALFLDGLADGLEPIQSLGLYKDFKDLTPIGAEGDLMVRKMVRRLVDVDLLDQAAELLQYQVDNRLDGVPKAQVATDLALIYLMNRQPEQALQAINASRTTVLPSALNAERRMITARALMGVGRLDAALEVLENDSGPEATDVRAEVAWKARNWPLAAEMLERQLADRWKTPLALRPDEEGRLLRAGVAYSLAGDEAALTRMRGRFEPLFDGARNPDALRVAFARLDGERIGTADFGRAVAETEAFNGWVGRMKQKFREKPAPVMAAAKGPAPTAPKGAAKGEP